jgi:nickel/cobalt transporter (NicO) family protein
MRYSKRWTRLLMGIASCLGAIAIWLLTATPSQAHWSDMSAAEITFKDAAVEMILTFPTGLVSFADRDRNQQLSADEITVHNTVLKNLFDRQIQLTANNTAGQLTIQPMPTGSLPPSVQIAPTTHSTIQLNYTWSKPIQGLNIHYSLFLPGITTAHCLATILQAGQLKTFLFTPNNQNFSLLPEGAIHGEWGLTIAAAFLWGAMHSLTPGHGKTLVGAYLMGKKATPKHALLLAMTTTITHTLGVFALGLVALFAAKYILPEQLYPWFSLISGVMVMAIGLNLFRSRMRSSSHHHDHSHDHHPDHHHSDHHHHHHHDHHHSIDKSISASSLLALGISGGLLPCPAALVLLLGAIAVHKTVLGLVLVISFSLGLAGVLTGLGLLLIYAKRLFKQVPTSFPRFVKVLPALSAIVITLIGTGISTQAFIQVLGIHGG